MTNITFNSNRASRWANVSASAAIVLISIALLLPGTLMQAQQTDPAATQAAGIQDTARTVTVPAGTRMMVRMIDPVDSDRNRENDRFRGSLEANLIVGNVVVAPKGTTVFGRLVSASSAGRRSGGELELDLTDIVIDGQMHSLATSSHQVQGEGSGGEAASQTARGAGTGAAIGAMAGGASGMGIGAGAGAVAGKISSGNTRGERVNVPANTMVEFTLEHPVQLPVTK